MPPFSRSWSTAQTSELPSSASFTDLLSHAPPIPSRAILAAAVSPSPDTYLPSIIRAHPALSDWPAVIAASSYPPFSLPPDHHSLDPILASLSFSTFSPAAFPSNSTSHSPLDHVALGLHYPQPPTLTPQSLAPIPTLSHYSLVPDITPSLDYLVEFGFKAPPKPPQKPKVVLAQKHAPASSKPSASIFRVPKHDVHATITLGRKRSALGSPALNRRDKPIEKTFRPSPTFSIPLSKPVPRPVLRSSPPSGAEVIALDDDDEFSLARQNQIASHPPLQPATDAQAEDGLAAPAQQEVAQDVAAERDEQSQPVPRRRALTAEERAAFIDVDAIIGDIGDKDDQDVIDTPVGNGDRVDLSADTSALGHGESGPAAGQKRQSIQVRESDEEREIGWKKRPDMNRVFNALDSAQSRTQMRRESLRRLEEIDAAKLPVPDSAQALRNKKSKSKKQSALVAKEKQRMAALKQLEKKKKLARRKRKVAAKARGKVYESDSEEENTDPAEPEDNEAEQDSVQNQGAEHGEDEVIQIDPPVNSKSAVRARSPPSNTHSQHPSKRQRFDNPSGYAQQHPYQDNDAAPPPHAPNPRVHGQHSVGNRGLPPPQHPFNGGHLHPPPDYRARAGPPHPHGAFAQGPPPPYGAPPHAPPPYRGAEYPPQPYPQGGQYLGNGQYPPSGSFPPRHAPYHPPPPGGGYASPSGSYTSATHIDRVHNYVPGNQYAAGPPHVSPYPNSYPPHEHQPPHPYYGASLPPHVEPRPRYPQPVFEQKRKELYDRIQSAMADLTANDRIAIDAFLDNQRDMFLPEEDFKDYRLQLRNRVLTKLRINKRDGTWNIVRARV